MHSGGFEVQGFGHHQFPSPVCGLNTFFPPLTAAANVTCSECWIFLLWRVYTLTIFCLQQCGDYLAGWKKQHVPNKHNILQECQGVSSWLAWCAVSLRGEGRSLVLWLGDQASDTGTGVESPCLSIFICKMYYTISRLFWELNGLL